VDGLFDSEKEFLLGVLVAESVLIDFDKGQEALFSLVDCQYGYYFAADHGNNYED